MLAHLNAYWELSTNRRSIWSGEEMEHRGKWNDALMKDCVSLAYIDLITEIKDRTTFKGISEEDSLSLLSKYYSIFPDFSKLIPVMANLGKYFYQELLGRPLFWSKSHQKWVSIGEEKVFFNVSNWYLAFILISFDL